MKVRKFLSHVFLSACMLTIFTSSCSSPTEPDESLPSITGVWTFGVSADSACAATLPSGYGRAPNGGGQAILTQSGNRFSGELLIFGVHSGSIDGTRQGSNIQANIRLDGMNQGILKPEDAPCRVVASGTGDVSRQSGPGTKPTICHILLHLDGDFACPYSCAASRHIALLERPCG